MMIYDAKIWFWMMNAYGNQETMMNFFRSNKQSAWLRLQHLKAIFQEIYLNQSFR